MKTRINRLLNRLKVEYAAFWVLCLLLLCLYETEVLPQGIWAGDVRMEYILQTVGILLAVAFIPLSLRVFSLSLTRYVRQLPLEEALQSYCRWNEVRTAMLLVPALFNFSVYFWTLNTTGLLCGIMVLVASLFCVPGRKRLLSELDLNDLSEV